MKQVALFILLGLVWVSSLAPVMAQEIDREVTAGDPMFEDFIDLGQISNETLEGEIVEILAEDMVPYDETQTIVYQTVLVFVTKGSVKGKNIEVEYNRTISEGEPILEVGDKILINSSHYNNQEPVYYVIDFVRRDALFNLFLLFTLIVLLVGRWHGVSSLLGLASSFVIIFTVILPGIQRGFDPLVVAIAGAALIIGITFYTTHGINEKTSWAVMGTLVSLLITGLLAHYFIDAAKLTGFGAEEVAFLQVLKAGELNVKGLLLAGIIIGVLGVLDDITISQVSIVRELKLANAKLKSEELFFKAMNVGRDHIASLVNTMILVYTGGSLPLLLLFTVDSSRTAMDVINYEVVTEQIVQTLVASIGLIIAVPISTALAAWFGFKRLKVETTVKKKKAKEIHLGHSH